MSDAPLIPNNALSKIVLGAVSTIVAAFITYASATLQSIDDKSSRVSVQMEGLRQWSNLIETEMHDLSVRIDSTQTRIDDLFHQAASRLGTIERRIATVEAKQNVRQDIVDWATQKMAAESLDAEGDGGP